MGTSSDAGNFRNDGGTAIDSNSWQRLDDAAPAEHKPAKRTRVNRILLMTKRLAFWPVD
jgi:hypothetical protein